MKPAASEINSESWSRHVESLRRRLGKATPYDGPFNSRPYLAQATYTSFRLEGLEVTEAQVLAALATGPHRRVFRSRQAQRLRNHVALLREIDAQLIAGELLAATSIVRWYASLSCGLCPADLGEAAMARLVEQVHRMNFPELRLTGAIQEIARAHADLLIDPLVPSFNGILCRLLLRYHLGRCGLPPVMFDPNTPPAALTNQSILLPMLMELIENSYDLILQGR